jgi:hypothetical protein
MNFDRRRLLKMAALSAVPLRAAAAPTFRHRGYLGWITDLDPRPDPEAAWPSMRLDATLVAEYCETFRLMHLLGFNNAVIWGLYVSRYWPKDLASAVAPERGPMVQQIIDFAHSEGIRVVCGLGVFSWGYEKLIREFPRLSRTNPKAMCASSPEAWRWMEKITDFVMTRFPIDGVSMQSADLGRCNCEQCSRYGDAEYHARINVREAGYIRSRWPGKIVAVSGWGMKFEDPASRPFLLQMGEKLDYIIDVADSTRERGNEYQRDVIRDLKCDFGTIGGPSVEPPQHWARDRWFLPTVRAQGEHLKELTANGGRAMEYFFHIRANPGDEVSFWVTGKVLNDIDTPWEHHLRSALEQLYGVRRRSTLDALADVFVRAEDAYMTRIKPSFGGDISLEPLVSSTPGPPVYLTDRLTGEGRAQYALDLTKIRAEFRKLASDVPDATRMQRILRCLDNVQEDLRAIHA